MKKYVVILAAGKGERFGSDNGPKQFVEVLGKTVLEHAIDACDCGIFDEMIVVVPRDRVSSFSKKMSTYGGRAKIRVVAGGSTRVESCRCGIEAIDDGDAYVVIHNGAQPLVSRSSFENCIRGLENSEAVVTSVPCVYTVLKVDRTGHVTDIPDRSTLRQDMGEEGFRLSLLRKLFSAEKQAGDPTSIVRLVVESGISTVLSVEGEAENVKITYRKDIDEVTQRIGEKGRMD